MVPFKGVNHRKNTWKGQYINFKSFAPISYKRTLVRTLYDRVRKICSEDNLEKEMEFLHETFKRNGYPTRFIEKYCKQRPKVAVDTVPRMKVYLSLPYKGDNVTTVIKRRLNLAIQTNVSCSISNLHREDDTSARATPQRQRFYTRHITVCLPILLFLRMQVHWPYSEKPVHSHRGTHSFMVEVRGYWHSEKCYNQALTPDWPQSRLWKGIQGDLSS